MIELVRTDRIAIAQNMDKLPMSVKGHIMSTPFVRSCVQEFDR